MDKKIYTKNKGVLEVIEPFEFLRGIDNKNTLMGKAKDKNGEVYEIYTEKCDLESCYCWSRAELSK
jgi:hypothetical protein